MPNSACALMSHHARPIRVIRRASLAKEGALHGINHSQDHFVALASRQDVNRLHGRKVKPLPGIVLGEGITKVVSRTLDHSKATPRCIVNIKGITQHLLSSKISLRTNNPSVLIL